MKFASYLQLICDVLYCYAKGENMLSVMISLCLAGVTRNTCNTSIYSILVGYMHGCLPYTGQCSIAPQIQKQSPTAPQMRPSDYATRKFRNPNSWNPLHLLPGRFRFLEIWFMNEISLKSIKKHLEFLFWFWYVQGGKST